MGALKVRVGGSWVTIPGYGNTLGVPAGGVLGDVLIKNSATGGDARWGTNPPKLNLTSAQDVTLASTDHALTLGPLNSQNVGAYRSGFQSLNNGAISTLRLNYYGGSVAIGGIDPTSQYLPLTLADSAHATSRRSAIQIGSGWIIGQDLNQTGVKDFFIFNIVNNRIGLHFGAAGSTFSLGGAGQVVDLVLSSGAIADTTAAGGLPRLSSNGQWINLHGKTDTYVDGDNVYVRSAAYGVKANFASDGFLYFNGSNNKIGYNGEFRIITGNSTLTVQADNFQVLNQASSNWKFRHNGTSFENWGGFTNHGDVSIDNDLYTGSGYYIRIRGSNGIYWQDYGCGFVSSVSGVVNMYGGTTLSMAGGKIRFYNTITDDNHHLRYYNGTPPGSGEANNGPLLQGFTSVWLHNVAYNKPFYLGSNGNVFIAAGSSYLTMSSREFKRNIKPLDPERALLMIERWNPVEYDWNEDLNTPHPHGFGFISEEHVEVLPEMCNIYGESVEGPENECLVVHRPGWANGIDYSLAVPWLTAAMHALVARIADLEGRLTNE